MTRHFLRTLRLAVTLATAGFSGAAFAQSSGGGASYAGESRDPVSGYRCVTPFCDTVAIPDTNCLCQKLNPNETQRQDVRYACTDMKTRQQCSVTPN